ncbi:MAG: hypothetical protein NTZ46_08690 [Verrucomicrobia bacterium]|nr:hypothetical protein [Verrucomicrobiota bacterium]
MLPLISHNGQRLPRIKRPWPFAILLTALLACIAQPLFAKVEVLKESDAVTLSNNAVRLKIDVVKRILTLTDAATGEVVLDKAWVLVDGWGNDPQLDISYDFKGWTASQTQESVDDAFGKGMRVVVSLTNANRPSLPTYLFRYTVYDNNGAVFMGFGMRNQTDHDVRLMTAAPLIGGELLPGSSPENLMTLNGSAGAEKAAVKHGAERSSANSLMLTCTTTKGRRSVVWGGLRNKEFGKYAALSKNRLGFSAKDPVGRLVDAGQTYWAEDTFYLDVTTADPFVALEQYGRAMRLANNAKPNVYDFPVLCGWGVGALSKLPNVNNSLKLVGELDAAQKIGLTKYTKVGIRLEPDTYCYRDGNTEQGWWDDEHWAKYKHLVPPYETFSKWCAAITQRNGIPYTYFQTGMPSDDYARAFPDHMLFKDISRLQVQHKHAQPLVSYDYTSAGFQKRTLQMWQRLRNDGMCGIKFDYPETAWRPEGGFEDRHATTAFAYREAFRLCREGLGAGAFLDERNLGQAGRPCLDLTAGVVDTQRNWSDSNKFVPGMVTIGGLRWYKNRTVFNYYPDSKTVHDCTKGIRQSILTMVYLTSGRIDLATSFTLFTPEILHDFTRIYPAYREPVTARPLDAFSGGVDPKIYDLELTRDWHQVALFNSSPQSGKVGVALSGDRVTTGAVGLDPSASYYVYEFWSDTLMGKYPGTARIEQPLEPCCCAMLSIRKVQDVPQVLSTNRHVLQGWVDLASVQWNPKDKKLEGVAKVIGGEPFRITLAQNGAKPFHATAVGAKARLEAHPAGDGFVTLVIERQENGETAWSVDFK